jgi:hypothetical protein
VWRRPEIFALVFSACACNRAAPTASDASPPPPSALPAVAVTIDASALGSSSAPAPAAPPARHARKAKSIGHTSVVLKIEQTDGAKIAWKPDSRVGRGRFKGEIAAYRLAQLLGIENVPPALPLDLERDELARAVENDEKAKQLLDDQIVFDGTLAHGAFTEWIDDYAVLPLEKESEWRTWLKKGASIPDAKKELARETSTLVLFDYLTANWDRWSGANVASSKGKMLYVDNDGAFFENPPKDGLARNKKNLEGVERFSKTVVERLRAVGDAEIASAIDILSKKAIDGVLARRKEALGMLENKDLFFPGFNQDGRVAAIR